MIRPLGENVVLKQLEAESKTKGGIILTTANQEIPQVAEVIAVGPGTKDAPMELYPGEKVIFKKYGGTDVTINGEDLIIMPQYDILAVLD